jgi:hypothetical protein
MTLFLKALREAGEVAPREASDHISRELRHFDVFMTDVKGLAALRRPCGRLAYLLVLDRGSRFDGRDRQTLRAICFGDKGDLRCLTPTSPLPSRN